MSEEGAPSRLADSLFVPKRKTEGLPRNGLTEEIKGADKDGSVRLGPPRQIFLARVTLDRLSVCAEHLEFVFAVAAKVIVQSLAANFASHARVGLLAPKNDDLTVENPVFVRFGKFEFVALRWLVGFVSRFVRFAVPKIFKSIVDDGFELRDLVICELFEFTGAASLG